MRLPSPPPPRNRRRQRRGGRKQSRTFQQHRLVLFGLSMFLFVYFGTLLFAHGLLGALSDEPPRHLRRVPPEQRRELTLDMTNGRKYIVFDGFIKGQGVGNIMAGLLAAHLLGYEYNRTVCVSDNFPDFHLAFEAVYPDAVAHCSQIRKLALVDKESPFSLCNFGIPVDECNLQMRMASDAPILSMKGNTYPRWPRIPENFFFRFYKAKTELLQILPYDPANPPETVVHLRAPDDPQSDIRQGLDRPSFKALGNLLPSDTFLVTNRVAWYAFFEREYHWKHANWKEVVHSGLDISWGGRGLSMWDLKSAGLSMLETTTSNSQKMQMWADWYTILTAKHVYHTHSDFSISAIHWQDLDSKSIGEYDRGRKQLKLQNESWRVDGETERLVERKLHGKGTSELRNCRSPKHKGPG